VVKESYRGSERAAVEQVRCKQRILAWRYMGTMHMYAWLSPHTSGRPSGASNVSGLTIELQHDQVLMPSLQLTGMEGKGVGDQAVRREAGRGSLGLSKPATQRAKAVGSITRFALSKGGLTTPTTQVLRSLGSP
jgi:hypothetical protein